MISIGMLIFLDSKVPIQVQPPLEASSVYEDINLHHVHDYILNNGLSVAQGDTLLELWSQVRIYCLRTNLQAKVEISDADWFVWLFQVLGIKTDIKPTVKSLNSRLLKFKQGTDIHEKSMNIAGLDGHQVHWYLKSCCLVKGFCDCMVLS
jgi:hypothetical protein